ncbi:MAG TPA: response regulator [Polyangia bacterium]
MRSPPLEVGGGTTVLVAEDDDALAEVLEAMLRERGYVAVRARDGAQALTLCARLAPALLLLDLVMPRRDGFEVLERLRGQRSAPRTIAMSAFHEFLPRARELGAAAVLPKPFGYADLDRALAAATAAGRPADAGAPAGTLAGAAPLPPGPLAAACCVGGTARASGAALPGLGGAPDEDDLRRVTRLHGLRVMESEPDAVLERLVRITAELLDTPIALVTIVTESRQWWKAAVGLPPELVAARSVPRDLSFCTHAVAARAPLVVGNARGHPFFGDNELVRRGPLVAYAGVPIEIAGVGALGTLCVIDTRPRAFSALDLELLGVLAARVEAEIEWRERSRLGDRPLGTMRYLALMDEKHGILNAQGFGSLARLVGRRALLQGEPFALAVFDRPLRGEWPDPEREPETALLLAAVRGVLPAGAFVGRLEDRGLAVVQRLREGPAATVIDAFVAAVLSGEAARRRAHPQGAAMPPAGGLGRGYDGALDAAPLLRRLHAELLGQLAR